MRRIDKDGLLLCEMQGKVFEESIDAFDCGSAIFVRRFVHSSIAKSFDDCTFLENSYSVDAVLYELQNEGHDLSYGSIKYSKNEMFWIGYTYRYLCYTHQISSRQAYAIIKASEMRSYYLPYHTLDCAQAIERILETKGYCVKTQDLTKKGVAILRRIKAQKQGERLTIAA